MIYSQRGKMIITTAAILVLAALMIFFALQVGSEKPETSLVTEMPNQVQVTAVVKPDQDALLVTEDKKVFVYVPILANNTDGVLILTRREPDLFPEPGPERVWYRNIVVNLDMFDRAGKLIPNVTFNKPFFVCFSLTDEEWSFYQGQPDFYDVQYYRLDQSKWLSLNLWPRPEVKQLCGEVDHLTLFALAVKSPPTPVAEPEGLYKP